MTKWKLYEYRYRTPDGRQIRKAIGGDCREGSWLCANVKDGKFFYHKLENILTEEEWLKRRNQKVK